MTAILLVFVLGYLAIVFEHKIRINKSATAVLTGVTCWLIYLMISPDEHVILEQLSHHIVGISGILFFLMAAMTIVELMDAHNAFDLVTQRIRTSSKRKMLWIIGAMAFILSAILDNLTSTIVLVSLTRKLVPDKEDRMMIAGLIVIAANAGGAWSPIGDVTTTMLWIGGQITTAPLIKNLILPSLACFIVPMLFIHFRLKGEASGLSSQKHPESPTERRDKILVLFTGIGGLFLVPILKQFFHLPPYMGILFSLGLIWIITEIIHSDKDEADRDKLTVGHAIRKIDLPSILFFLGILLAVTQLESAGVLREMADFLNTKLNNLSSVAILIGLLSSIVDNVPLIAACMGMYEMSVYPPDHYLWHFLAYSAGTGGSILIIGSAAGVAAMGLEKIEFFWYLRKIGWLAMIGFFSGAAVFMLLN